MNHTHGLPHASINKPDFALFPGLLWKKCHRCAETKRLRAEKPLTICTQRTLPIENDRRGCRTIDAAVCVKMGTPSRARRLGSHHQGSRAGDLNDVPDVSNTQPTLQIPNSSLRFPWPSRKLNQTQLLDLPDGFPIDAYNPCLKSLRNLRARMFSKWLLIPSASWTVSNSASEIAKGAI